MNTTAIRPRRMRGLLRALLAVGTAWALSGCCATDTVLLEANGGTRARLLQMPDDRRLELLSPVIVVAGEGPFTGEELRDAAPGAVLASGAVVLGRGEGVTVTLPGGPEPITLVSAEPGRDVSVRMLLTVTYCETFYSPPLLRPLDGVCGDGLLDGAEECDDGNDRSGDGCAECVVEAITCEAASRTHSSCDAFGCEQQLCPGADPVCDELASVTASTVIVGRSFPTDVASVVGGGLDCGCVEDAFGGSCVGTCEADVAPCTSLEGQGPPVVGFSGPCGDGAGCEINRLGERSVVASFDAGRSGTLERVVIEPRWIDVTDVAAAPDRVALVAPARLGVAGLETESRDGFAVYVLDGSGVGLHARWFPLAPSIALGEDGSLTVATSISAAFDPGSGSPIGPAMETSGDLWLLRFDRDGALRWASAAPREDGTPSFALDLVVHPDGSSTVLTSSSAPNDRVQLLRVDPTGAVVLRRTVLSGEPGYVAASIARDPRGGLRVAGMDLAGESATGMVPPRTGDPPHAWTVRVDDALTLLDADELEGPASGGSLQVALAVAPDGRARVALASDAHVRIDTISLHDLDADGLASARGAPMPLHPCRHGFPSLAATGDGSLLLATSSCPGASSRHALVTSFDSAGAARWTERLAVSGLEPASLNTVFVHAVLEHRGQVLVVEQAGPELALRWLEPTPGP